MSKQSNYVRTQVRLEPDLYEAIKQAAGDRSLNETIQQLLWVGLQQGGTDSPTSIEARLARLEQIVDGLLKRGR